MDGNRSESEKCISLALQCLVQGNIDKARKYLIKAQKLYPSNKAAELLNKLKHHTTNDEAQSGAHVRQRKHSHSDAEKSSTESKKLHIDYTEEQLEAVKRINGCKDVYKVLELSKDFKEMDLKKAYKRLALQMHPDKNKAPGATEAFKAVGSAYSILSDKEKRKQYDLYGPEMQPSQPSRDYNDNSHGFEDDVTPEELFNMFFQNGFSSGHANRQQHKTRRTFYTSQQSEGGLAALFQLAPILILVAASMLGGLLVSDPLFSLQRTEKYRTERRTTSLRIPYYVKDDFHVQYSSDLHRIERAVEEKYIEQLQTNCFRERSYKENMMYRARNYGDAKMYQKAVDLTTPSCDNLQNVYA